MNDLVAVREDGTPVHEGDEVKDFRGTPWEFIRPTRERVPGYSGKVEVRDLDTGRTREFYDGVFDLTVERS